MKFSQLLRPNRLLEPVITAVAPLNSIADLQPEKWDLARKLAAEYVRKNKLYYLWTNSRGDHIFLPLKLGLIGFVLGLYWVCFQKVPNLIYFHNPLLIL